MSSLHNGLPPQPQQQTDLPPSEFRTILNKATDTITHDEFKKLKSWKLNEGIDYQTSLQKQELENEIRAKILDWGINNARRVFLQQEELRKQEERETRAAINAVAEYELNNDPVLLEKREAQRREEERQREKQQRDEEAHMEFREREKGENQYTSHRPSGVGISGVGWMGWDANDQANWLKQGTSSDGVSAINWRGLGDGRASHWH
jgi:hypothetical protein